MNRRDFALSALATATLVMLPKRARAERLAPQVDMSPLRRETYFGPSQTIEGDSPDEAHEIFWNKDGYIAKKGGMPAVSAQYDVIIVGGGMAGLSAAYYLNGKKVLLLEGNPRLGGNSKSQVYGKSYASEGAAYIAQNEDGDEIDQFLTSLNIKKNFRKVNHDGETVFLNGKTVPGFWQGATDPARADEFRFANEKLKSIYENAYPELPIWDNSTSARTYFNSLDNMSLSQWCERELKTNHPHIWEYISLYCWSSFSAAPSEISAAQGLNFLSSDMCGIQVLPGGNGIISQAIYENLRRRSNLTLLSNSFAVDVRSVGGKAVVCYKNADNTLITVTAKNCIVASNKLVMKKILHQPPAPQLKAMSDISYRAYLVANVYLKKKIPSLDYDVFNLKGAMPQSEYQDSKSRTIADVVFADWALNDVADKSVITLYLPLPYEMAQQYLFAPDLYNKYLTRVGHAITPILPSLGLSMSDVEGMRLVRYGHSMPVAHTKGVSSGMFERASSSIDGCIHFANQDNWGNPCFETSFGSALGAVRAVLN